MLKGCETSVLKQVAQSFETLKNFWMWKLCPLINCNVNDFFK